MIQLPGTCEDQDHDLHQAVPHCLRVRRLTQISKIRLSLPLVLLFATDVFQLLIQVANLARQFGDMTTVTFGIRLGVAYDDIQIKFNVGARKPRRVIRG